MKITDKIIKSCEEIIRLCNESFEDTLGKFEVCSPKDEPNYYLD
jgi:hypothetical protein